MEKLVTLFSFVTAWEVDTGCVSLKNAEQIRRRLEADGHQARVKHESDY